MRCQNWTCSKQATGVVRAGKEYCSSDCVQQDLGKSEFDIISEKTVKSLREELGGTSQRTSGTESTTDGEKMKVSEHRIKREMDAQDTGDSQSEQNSRKLKVESEITLASANEREHSEVQRGLSTELLPISETEKYHQENLIESSIRQTYSLSKHVMEKVKESEVVDPAQVNAACNAVKQMHSLMKLRLDIHRTMKK
jgi:hypothetical protein